MFKSKFHWLQLCIILGMFALGRYFYDRLPEMITVHRNSEGVADRFETKNLISVGTLPALAFLTLILMKRAPFLDPRKEKYQQFSGVYEIIQTIIIGFWGYIYAVILLMNSYPSLNIFRFFLFGFGALMLLIGNYLPKVRRNYFVGIRTPRTLNDETVWNKTHRLGGIDFFWLGISLLINSYFLRFPVWHMGIIVGLAFFLCVYSYWLSKSKK